jgi:drug/metabolite transporter (DMT)-like permease
MKERIFQHKVTSVLLTLLVCGLWGSLYPFIKIGYQAFSIDAGNIPSIMLFAGLRFALCGGILAVALAGRERCWELPRKTQWSPILLVALFTIVLHYGFTYVGLSLGESSKGAIVKQVGFLFLSCFSFLFVKEEGFSVAKLLAGLLGFVGIVVTAMDGTGFHFTVGDVLLVLSSLCTVCSAVISKRSFSRVDPVRLVAYSQLVGGLCMLLCGLCMGGRIGRVNVWAVLAFAYICVASIAAYVLWNLLLRVNSLAKLSIIKFSEPLFAVLFSGLWLGEDIWKLSYLFALLLVLAAILLCNLSIPFPKRKQAAEKGQN